jgi:pyruvate dehydrogenase E2 component (dihydrolipoyllysine-residue acetyltransferase)
VTDAPSADGDSGADLVEEVPLTGMRGVIARRMTESLQEAAQLTLHREIAADHLVQFRNDSSLDPRPSINDLLLAAVARALAEHPEVNATLENGTISRWRRVHLGTAVAVPGGLVVPVIRDADQLSLPALCSEANRLQGLARTGGLTIPDLEGGTFTVSNLGAFGIDSFTPIINPPQVAILGVGRIHREHMTLSLTIDHRAIDGVPGAQFLDDLAQAVGNLSWL